MDNAGRLQQGYKRYAEQKKRKAQRPAEIVFDKEARKEYLTGFHRRKNERRKRAQAEKEAMEKKVRLERRRQIREENKRALQERLAQFAAETGDGLVDPRGHDDGDDDADDDSNDADDANPKDMAGTVDYENELNETTVTVTYSDDETDSSPTVAGGPGSPGPDTELEGDKPKKQARRRHKFRYTEEDELSKKPRFKAKKPGKSSITSGRTNKGSGGGGGNKRPKGKKRAHGR